MSSRDDDEELAVLLADLERTLTDLRAAVDDDVRRRRRPPTPGEILRFTEEYTIPTMIALLEATVRSLELLRAVLRIAGPGARLTEDRLRESDEAPDADVLRDALTDLRDALTGAELPRDSAASSVLADARELTGEIDDRLAEASGRERGRDERGSDRRERADARGVAIDVREETDGAQGETDPGGGVNVDEELASIKESMTDEGADDDQAEDDGDDERDEEPLEGDRGNDVDDETREGDDGDGATG